MNPTGKKTIKLRKHIDIINERAASAVITPGMLLDFNSSNEYLPHGAAAAAALPPIVALEDELRGQTIDDNYEVGEPVQAWTMNAGEEFLALLADGQTLVVGDALVSDGAGKFAKSAAPATDVVIARVMEPVTASPAGTHIRALAV